ncbi:MAG: AzlD domain-containing protein [Fibrobacteraceae bacterium]|nr:AzlD domain-containing protein [Fibrobacteraceae bacterium]MEE1068588.1 AzlD domain-containing protein [Fibrobacteraceae bacterium]
MSLEVFFKYLFVMAFVTYLLRALPFILLKRQIENVFWKSFLAYIPYTVLAAMTIPGIFKATEFLPASVAALCLATLFSLKGHGLVLVALVACLAVMAVNGLHLWI